jgi:hypothetical protein
MMQLAAKRLSVECSSRLTTKDNIWFKQQEHDASNDRKPMVHTTPPTACLARASATGQTIGCGRPGKTYPCSPNGGSTLLGAVACCMRDNVAMHNVYYYSVDIVREPAVFIALVAITNAILSK